jgi:hypothetical protein
VTCSVKTENRQLSFRHPEISYPINRGCGAISAPPESGVWPQKSYSPEIGGTYRVSPYMVVAAAARAAPIPLTATAAITTPRADWLAADWLALVDRWRPQIVNYVEGEFTIDGRTERRLYDTTRVLRSAIVRDVIGCWAVSTDWANAVVDAVMDVPAWKRIALVDDCVGYRLAGTRLEKGEKMALVLSTKERAVNAHAGTDCTICSVRVASRQVP